MKITKLSWAGIQVTTDEGVILIDPLHSEPLGQEKAFVARLGSPKEEIYKLSNLSKPDAILITHNHPDHFDFKGIQACFGLDIPIYAPHDSKEYISKLGFTHIHGVQVNEYYFLKNKVKMIPTYSVDGYGSTQVAWVIKTADRTIIHCGDTLWHGYWWKIEKEFGPFDCTFMPVNGPCLNMKGLKHQSILPACLTPEEAIEATYLLGSKKLVPIHFDTFNNPPYYSETENILKRLQYSSEKYDIEVKALMDGQEYEI